MTEFGLNEILTIAGTAGGTLLLVKFILGNHDERLNKLEHFKGQVLMPNVGVSMCDTKHKQLETGMKFVFEKCEKMVERMDRDHDVLVQMVTKLGDIESKIDRLNHG